MKGPRELPIAVLGAGPAGLAAAVRLSRAGRKVLLVEREALVGGLARTVERDGYRFDLGGHRFFTRDPEIEALWAEFARGDLLVRQRRSRILFAGRTFDYPITASSALAGLGPLEGARILASYAAARLHPTRPERSIADWISNRFGRRLFDLFFRSYTEKLWGLPCDQIGAEWAAQRIRGLSLRAALVDALRRGSGGHRTLATEFRYPRLGPGMIWDRMRQEVEQAGSELLLSTEAVALEQEQGRVVSVLLEGPSGQVRREVSGAVSTLPLRALARALSPALASDALAAATSLRHRDFIEVALILEGHDPFPETWLYLHDPGVRAGRVQNFRAWSPELLPETGRACVGFEYFCNAGDGLWRLSDPALVEVAARDLEAIGYPGRRVVAGYPVRVRDAYPVYDDGYQDRIALLARALAPVANLAVAGRNGTHRYDNMDRAMLSGLRAAENLLGARHDLWAVAARDDYLEPGAVS